MGRWAFVKEGRDQNSTGTAGTAADEATGMVEQLIMETFQDIWQRLPPPSLMSKIEAAKRIGETLGEQV